jgi:hypothetical protein
MIGDQADFQGRLRALLPKTWFPVRNSPNLDASLQGPGWALSSVYAQITYATMQTRIKTATDGWLDIISGDFFGITLPRLTNEQDGQFRARILANLFVKGPRRGDMSKVLTLITGQVPLIFEPSNTTDSGGWDSRLYWDIGTGSGLGDPMPYQCLITAYRPTGGNIDLGEWDEYTFSWDSWGAWSDLNITSLTDAAIIAAVESTKPVATLCWLRIANAAVSP